MRDVRVESHGSIRVVRVDRPARRNALNSAALQTMASIARELAHDASVRGVVLTGTGPVFVAGGDLDEFQHAHGVAGGERVNALGCAVIEAFRALDVPWIAAVQGDAFGGGCELAAACDVRVVEEHVRFHWTQGNFAVTTGWGGTAALVQWVGRARAMEWLLSRRAVHASEAFQAGFATRVVETGTSVTRALEWMDEHTRGDRGWLRAQVRLLRSTSMREDERAVFAECWASEAHEESVQRFLRGASKR